MKKLIIALLLLSGCVASADKQRISYEAARLDRAVALISTSNPALKPSQQDLENLIRGERAVWHALDFSINGNPLPPDLQPPTSK